MDHRKMILSFIKSINHWDFRSTGRVSHDGVSLQDQCIKFIVSREDLTRKLLNAINNYEIGDTILDDLIKEKEKHRKIVISFIESINPWHFRRTGRVSRDEMSLKDQCIDFIFSKENLTKKLLNAINKYEIRDTILDDWFRN